MTNLSLPKLAEKAPAAAPRKNAKDEKILDTHAFLRHVRAAYDMTEIGVAVQGTRHEDSKKAKARDGRHLVAATRKSDGLTFFLLNSHFKDRRAHLGVGIQREGSFLIGPSMAIQRWKGFEEPVDILASYFAQVRRVVEAFDKMKLTDKEIVTLAKTMSRRGYMETVESRPSPKALTDGLYSNRALDAGYHVIGRMRTGNLEAAEEGGRRIKRVRRPDGLFHAGMIAFDCLLKMAHERHAVAASVNFGDVKDRLIRP